MPAASPATTPIRSLLLSQRLLGTNAVMVIHHTRCGLETFEEEALADEIETPRRRRGRRFDWVPTSDVDEDVRSTVATLAREPLRRLDRDPRLRLQRGRRRPARGQSKNFLKP